jgi:tRNA (guanine37-N1)-methyltransferase
VSSSSSLKIDVFTLFPQWFDWFGAQRHVQNALEDGTELRFFNYRDSTPLGGGQVDDAPYGGGAGMVLRVDVVDAALASAYDDGREPSRVIVLAPSGRQLDDALATELASEPHLALLSGRYEGIDERVREHLATDAISIGPYVLSGGELAAMVLADAVIRKLPGALGHAESVVEESFSAALGGGPEYPHYTRPASYRGWEVPQVLLSGDHARVREWRLARSRNRQPSSQGR